MINKDLSIQKRYFTIDGKKFEFVACDGYRNGNELSLANSIDTIKDENGKIYERTRIKMYEYFNKILTDSE